MTAKPASQRPLASGEYLATLQEVATELGVTKERVRQIESKALHKLRKQLSKRGISAEDIF